MKARWWVFAVTVNVVIITIMTYMISIDKPQAPPLEILINDRATTFEPHESCPADKLEILDELNKLGGKEGLNEVRYLI